MSEIVKTYQLYLSSEFADFKPYSDYCGWTLKNPIILSDENNYFTCRILQSAIPYSFKQFQGTTVSGNYVHSGVTTPFVLTISDGNYSIIELLAEFQTQLEAVPHSHTWNFNFTYDPIDSHCSFVFTSNQLYQFNFTYSGGAVFWKACGFLSTDTLVFGNNPATTLTSSRHVNVHPINAIQIRSDTLFQINGNSESLVEVNDYSDILCQYYVYGSPNTWILSESGESQPRVMLKNKVIDFPRLYLSSNVNYRLNISNLDWSVVLEITEHERRKVEQDVNPRQNEDAMRALASIRQQLIQELQANRNDLSAELSQNLQQPIENQ